MGPIELLTTTIAVVFDPAPPPDIQLSEAFRRFMRVPLNISQGLDGSLMVVSNRDQIEVSLSPNKADVRDVSGIVERAQTTVPKVLAGVSEILSSSKTRSYGINFLFECNLDGDEDADAWLGRIFVDDRIVEVLGTSPSSDSIMISYGNGSKVQTIRLRVGDQRRIVANSNASEEIDTLPDNEKLEREIISQYHYLTELLRKVGGK